MHTRPTREGEAMPLRQDELLDLKAVCAFFGGLDPSTIYRSIKRGAIPAPIKVGPNSSRWLARECEAALAAMIERRTVNA
jgi:predicted DNA-binding transcriptional regulator AlpA